MTVKLSKNVLHKENIFFQHEWSLSILLLRPSLRLLHPKGQGQWKTALTAHGWTGMHLSGNRTSVSVEAYVTPWPESKPGMEWKLLQEAVQRDAELPFVGGWEWEWEWWGDLTIERIIVSEEVNFHFKETCSSRPHFSRRVNLSFKTHLERVIIP